ncbi:phospholipase D family protein [Sphingomonas sp.]|uniref:phospholipase D family protein n=1 Tax=Sphingomonas sp. TaxID=28214 RepID=UPI0025FDC494|nr:phospholipase D family protein [Sphingomonas sp.]
MARSTLDPETRLLYGESLQAPLGYRFDGGIATTFSLDFATALAVPVSLALFAAENRDEILSHPIALLEGTERIAGKLAVYVDAGQIHAEHGPGNRLSSLLERVIVEVEALGGGSFHPKLWALRFRPLQGEGPTLMRLLILSRNLTRDRSWDAIVRLDGERGRRPVASNRPLRNLVAALPTMTVGEVDEHRRMLTAEIAEDLSHTRWEPPENCDEVTFAVNGIGRSRWTPEPSRRIAVVSPFCDGAALDHLASLAGERPILISRPDQLVCVDDETLDQFERVAVLDELAESEDGEETRAGEQRGLHAKIYIQEQGWRTRLTLGSGNATGAALLAAGRKPTVNVEVFATLHGMRSRLGGIDDILGVSGFGRLTRPFERGEVAKPKSTDISAERALLDARRVLARGGLRLRCEAVNEEGDARWRMWLVPPEGGLEVGRIGRIRVWLITLGEGHHRDALDAIRSGCVLDLGEVALVDVTRFLAIEITESETGRTELFSTGVPVDGMPAERDGAILKWVINSRETFLRYLRLLLAELGDPLGAALAANEGAAGKDWGAGADDEPLLEDLIRSLCADDGRLEAVERLVARLEASGATGEQGVPDEFLSLWQVFRAALSGAADAR